MNEPLAGLRAWISQTVREELQAALTDHRVNSEFLTTREAAELARVTGRTIRQWIRAGRLSGMNAGRVLRVRRADLLQLMSGSRSGRKPSPEALAALDFKPRRSRSESKK